MTVVEKKNRCWALLLALTLIIPPLPSYSAPPKDKNLENIKILRNAVIRVRQDIERSIKDPGFDFLWNTTKKTYRALDDQIQVIKSRYRNEEDPDTKIAHLSALLELELLRFIPQPMGSYYMGLRTLNLIHTDRRYLEDLFVLLEKLHLQNDDQMQAKITRARAADFRGEPVLAARIYKNIHEELQQVHPEEARALETYISKQLEQILGKRALYLANFWEGVSNYQLELVKSGVLGKTREWFNSPKLRLQEAEFKIAQALTRHMETNFTPTFTDGLNQVVSTSADLRAAYRLLTQDKLESVSPVLNMLLKMDSTPPSEPLDPLWLEMGKMFLDEGYPQLASLILHPDPSILTPPISEERNPAIAKEAESIYRKDVLGEGRWLTATQEKNFTYMAAQIVGAIVLITAFALIARRLEVRVGRLAVSQKLLRPGQSVSKLKDMPFMNQLKWTKIVSNTAFGLGTVILAQRLRKPDNPANLPDKSFSEIYLTVPGMVDFTYSVIAMLATTYFMHIWSAKAVVGVVGISVAGSFTASLISRKLWDKQLPPSEAVYNAAYGSVGTAWYGIIEQLTTMIALRMKGVPTTVGVGGMAAVGGLVAGNSSLSSMVYIWNLDSVQRRERLLKQLPPLFNPNIPLPQDDESFYKLLVELEQLTNKRRGQIADVSDDSTDPPISLN